MYLDVAKAYNSVDKWAAPKKAEFDLSFWAMGPKYRCEPKGVVLIISPFNGPVVLTLSPLVLYSSLGAKRMTYLTIHRLARSLEEMLPSSNPPNTRQPPAHYLRS